MALSNINVKFFVSLQQSVNNIQSSSANIDGTSFTLYKQGFEYNNIKQITDDISLDPGTYSIESIIAKIADSIPSGYNYYFDALDNNILKDKDGPIFFGTYKINKGNIDDEFPNGWTDGFIYIISSGENGEQLHDTITGYYFDSINIQLGNAVNGSDTDFPETRIYFYIKNIFDITAGDNSPAPAVESGAFYYNDINSNNIMGSYKILYVVNAFDASFYTSDNLKLTFTDETPSGLYYSDPSGMIIKYTDNYNFISKNTDTIYLTSNITKLVPNNTLYICDDCLLFKINHTYRKIKLV